MSETNGASKDNLLTTSSTEVLVSDGGDDDDKRQDEDDSDVSDGEISRMPMVFGDSLPVKFVGGSDEQEGRFVANHSATDVYTTTTTSADVKTATTTKDTKHAISARKDLAKRREVSATPVGLRNFLEPELFGLTAKDKYGFDTTAVVCYMNAIVQCLFAYDKFRDTVLEQDFPISTTTSATISDPIIRAQIRALKELQLLFARMRFSKRIAVDTTPFAYSVDRVFRMLKKDDAKIGTYCDVGTILSRLRDLVIVPAFKALGVSEAMRFMKFTEVHETARGSPPNEHESFMIMLKSRGGGNLDEIDEKEKLKCTDSYPKGTRPTRLNVTLSKALRNGEQFRSGFLKYKSMYHALDSCTQDPVVKFKDLPEFLHVDIPIQGGGTNTSVPAIEIDLFLDDYCVLKKDECKLTERPDIHKLKKALLEIEKKLDQVVNHPVTKDLRNFSSGGAVAALDDDFDVIFKSVISEIKQARDKLGQYVQNLIEAQKRKRKEIAEWFCANSKHHYRIHSAIEFSGPDGAGHYIAFINAGGDLWGSTELKWDDVESEVCKRVIDMYGIVEEVKKRCKNFFGLTIDDKTARDLLWKAKERGYGWNADGALHIKQNEDSKTAGDVSDGIDVNTTMRAIESTGGDEDEYEDDFEDTIQSKSAVMSSDIYKSAGKKARSAKRKEDDIRAAFTNTSFRNIRRLEMRHSRTNKIVVKSTMATRNSLEIGKSDRALDTTDAFSSYPYTPVC
eukprot:g2694.t1